MKVTAFAVHFMKVTAIIRFFARDLMKVTALLLGKDQTNGLQRLEL